MITEPELRDALTRQAESYEVPPCDLTSLRAASLRRRRNNRLRYGGIAAAALLAAGITVGQLRTGPVDGEPADSPSDVTASPSCFPPGEAPPVPDSPYAGGGFVSDEPVPATSPAPGGPPCTLVLHYGFHRFGNDLFLSGAAHLYSDGRLIVETATEKDWFVQWERRLTPAGAERIRNTVVIMLGDPIGQPSRNFEDVIHYGDDTFYPKDTGALVRLLIDLSWIPDEDWVTENPSIYRAAWYLTCYDKPGSDGLDVHAAVSNLPSDARDVLESRVWAANRALIARAPDAEEVVVRYLCVVLSRTDATMLVEALGGDITVGTANVLLRGLDGPAGRFSVHALMPDGTSGAHGD